MTSTAAQAAAKTLRERHWTGLCACASLLERSSVRVACQIVNCGEMNRAREQTSGSARWAAPARAPDGAGATACACCRMHHVDIKLGRSAACAPGVCGLGGDGGLLTKS